MKSIGKFARPETGSGTTGYTATKPVATTTYQPAPPRGPPPSAQIRTTYSHNYGLQEEPAVEEEIPLPMPSRPYGNQGGSVTSPRVNSPKSANSTYPQFRVGKLESAGDGTGNILPISDLACQLQELTITLKNEGKAIEFRRNITENDKPKVEGQVFNLPYQVSGNTCTAKYYPDEGNGTLKIRLGKIITGQAPRGEHVLLQYTVRGSPSAHSDRVEIAIDQQPDSYRFYPRGPSRFDTDFTVVINGQSLEFRSTYSVEEGDGVKTINATQKVNLPLAPTLDQIDAFGDSVTVSPGKTSGGPVQVPEQDLRIVMG